MADLSTMRIFNDKDEDWCDLFEECHKEEWRREAMENEYEDYGWEQIDEQIHKCR